MADSSLDDFFAKKDKSKKSKKKFATTEQQLAMNMDDAGVRKGGQDQRGPGGGGGKKDKEKNSNVSSSGGLTYAQKAEQDDEWREVLEKETDYTGLKIQNLQISELRDEEYEKEKLEELRAEEGDQSWQKDGSGPWNKSSATPTAPIPQEETLEPSEEKEDEEPAIVKPYVPPYQRAGRGSHNTSSKSRNKNAPEIDDEMHFPSLSSAADGRKKGYTSPDSERGFESVKRGGSRTMDDSGSRGPKLDLGNKYDALSHGETS